MKLQFNSSLGRGILLRRYKRFLADIEVIQWPNGEPAPANTLMTIHCPNTGAMTGCAEPGYTVYFSASDNAKRKYPHTWELAQDQQHQWIVINTQRANELAEISIRNAIIPPLAEFSSLQREVKYGMENSRIDLLLTQSGLAHYIEVKSVTLAEQDSGYFPDAVSTRAHKHMRELIEMTEQGHRASVIFMVTHTGISKVQPAAHIDPKYAELCKTAVNHGVNFFAVGCEINQQKIEPSCMLPVEI